VLYLLCVNVRVSRCDTCDTGRWLSAGLVYNKGRLQLRSSRTCVVRRTAVAMETDALLLQVLGCGTSF